MTPPIQITLTQQEAILVATAAVKELITDKYSFLDRWQRMLGEKLPAQARRDWERRELLLEAARVLEESSGVVK